jgi:hypothetical protein
LWRAYRTVLRIYQGEFTATIKTPAPAKTAVATKTGPAPPTWLDRTIPWLSEEANIVALASLRSLTRAPEAKMLLLSPFIMLMLAGGALFRIPNEEIPPFVPTLIAYTAIGMTLFMLMQIMGNQFGFDRAGFRIYILSPVPRRSILLGKNLAMIPVVAAMTLPTIVFLQFLHPMRFDHLLALPAQIVSMILVYSVVANALSILAPVAIAAGSLKPASPKGLVFLTHLLFLAVAPLSLAPTLLPLGIESALTALEWNAGLPICLLLTYAECVAISALYRLLIRWQGDWLVWRELKILETVTTKAE